MKNFSWPLINDNITEDDKRSLVEFIMTPGVRFTQHKNVKMFEKTWSEWLGVKHSAFVNSGASANYIMMSVVRDLFKEGEVIVPPLGWVSDIASVVNLGLTPVFVDVNMSNLSLDIDKVESAITSKTRAIVLVHALGFNGINHKLIDLCKRHNLILIEDCCESHGATFENRKIGTFGDMSNFSFYFGHHMTTIEGGIVSTNNSEMDDQVRLYRSHGMTREASSDLQEKYIKSHPDLNPLFTFAVPGYNLRGTEINAVIGLNQIKRLDKKGC